MRKMTPREIDGVAALLAAENTAMRKLKGERDTEFIKRIVCAYANALPEAARLDLLEQLTRRRTP